MISVNVHAGYESRDNCRKMLTQVLLLFSAMIATFIPGMNHQKNPPFFIINTPTSIFKSFVGPKEYLGAIV